jgi:hypothetical protein
LIHRVGARRYSRREGPLADAEKEAPACPVRRVMARNPHPRREWCAGIRWFPLSPEPGLTCRKVRQFGRLDTVDALAMGGECPVNM